MKPKDKQQQVDVRVSQKFLFENNQNDKNIYMEKKCVILNKLNNKYSQGAIRL